VVLEFFQVGVVAFLAIFQSFVGVGILFVGTPILLYFGYELFDILSTLVPASLALSVVNAIKYRDCIVLHASVFAVPFGVGIGLFLAQFIDKPALSILISVVLILLSYIGLSRKQGVYFESFMQGMFKKSLLYYSTLSLVHGLTNLGGGILVWYSNNTISEKNAVRATIAMVYAILAASQLLFLAVFHSDKFQISSGIYAPIVAVSVFFATDYFFCRINREKYRSMIYASMMFIGGFVILRELV
jgi:uncharacterized membrane protein YfcA